VNICIIVNDIDKKLQNKLRGPMHYQIGVTCLFIDSRYLLCSNDKKL